MTARSPSTRMNSRALHYYISEPSTMKVTSCDNFTTTYPRPSSRARLSFRAFQQERPVPLELEAGTHMRILMKPCFTIGYRHSVKLGCHNKVIDRQASVRVRKK